MYGCIILKAIRITRMVLVSGKDVINTNRNNPEKEIEIHIIHGIKADKVHLNTTDLRKRMEICIFFTKELVERQH